MEWDMYDKVIRKETEGRYDATSLFADASVFASLIDDLFHLHEEKTVTKVVGIDALGFVLASPLALKHKAGCVLLRKEGKLPLSEDRLITRSMVDYSGKTKGLALVKDDIAKGDTVLIIDDWIETGAQMRTAISLLEEAGATVVAVSAIQIEKNKKTDSLFAEYECKALNIAE